MTNDATRKLPPIFLNVRENSTAQSVSSLNSDSATNASPSVFNVNETIKGQQLEVLQRRLQEIEKATKEVQEKTRRTAAQISDVQSTYLFGLEQIAKLQDLREAPDAIMPGNLIPSAGAGPSPQGRKT